jgi:hypothetical protein
VIPKGGAGREGDGPTERWQEMDGWIFLLDDSSKFNMYLEGSMPAGYGMNIEE